MAEHTAPLWAHQCLGLQAPLAAEVEWLLRPFSGSLWCGKPSPVPEQEVSRVTRGIVEG